MAVYLRNFRSEIVLNLRIFRPWHCEKRSLAQLICGGALKRAQSITYPLRNVNTSVVYFKRRKTAEEKKAPRIIEFPSKSKNEVIGVWNGITMAELATVLKRDINYVRDLFLNEIHNPHTPIDDFKCLQNAVKRGGKRVKIIGRPIDANAEDKVKELKPRPPATKAELRPRPPVVTVMGHVDHGKTTLLDALRHSSVVEQEFGGITQHIGAFLVTLGSGAKITFLDTPGHAAFSSMRARGANLTDIVVLVVAADDGVMEQTLESVRMARNAKVPILVAINKIDSPKANIPRTENMLLEAGLQIEKLGGDIQAVPISALKKQNLNQLTEALVLQADLLDIGGDPTGPVEAVIVESNIHPFRGKLSTIVVQKGTLKKGDILVAGTAMAKVRTLKSADGVELSEVPPGYPAEIDGWRALPPAGEIVLQAESEKYAKQVIKFREEKLEERKMEDDLKVIEQKRDLHDKQYKEDVKRRRLLGKYRKSKPEGPRKPEIVEADGPPSINVIVKADVDGTLEAILETLDTYESEECRLDLVHYGVGPVTQTDLELAKSFNAIVYAFNVDFPNNLKPLISGSDVQVKEHNVIYRLIEDFKEEVNNSRFRKVMSSFDAESAPTSRHGSEVGHEFLSTSGLAMSFPNMDKLDGDFHLITDSKLPRPAQSGASSSEVFPASMMKQAGKRPQSAKIVAPKSPNSRSFSPLSSIPLPIRSSGPIKIPSLLKNARSTSRTSSLSASHTSTVANKHTLEIQFLNRNKRYLELKKELLEKQKPVVDMYRNLIQIKKRLDELGKFVKLEDFKLVAVSNYKKPLIQGSGEQIPAEVVNRMKSSLDEIPANLQDVCQNLLSRRNLIVELLENVTLGKVEIPEVADQIEPLKNEGLQLQHSLDAIIAEHQGKIAALVADWQALLTAKHSSNAVSDLELKLKEHDRLAQDSNHVIIELKRKLEDKRASYDKSVAELNGIIHTLRDQIKKLEDDLEHERKSAVDARSKNSTNLHSLKSMRAKIADLEAEKKSSDTANADLQKKIRLLQDQLKHKESQWSKEKDEMSKTISRQSSFLNKLNVDKTEYESTLEALEEAKVSTQEELQTTIEALNEELQRTKQGLEEANRAKEEAQGKCSAFEGYIAKMGFDCKEKMNQMSSSIEWGQALRNPNSSAAEDYIEDIAKDLRIRELQDTVRKLEAERIYQIEERKQLQENQLLEPTETEKQVSKQQECITKYHMLLEESESKLKEKFTEVNNLHAEIRQLKVRQEALEEQNYGCPTEQLQKMVEDGRHKLSELMRRSIESEQKLEHYSNLIEKQTQQMNEMENLLRYRENMAGVLKASRDELVLEKESLTRYSQEMRTVLAEVTKEGKMKDRLIKELQEKIDLRERQIAKLEKEVRELETNLMLTNEKRFKLQKTIGSMEKELQSTKAHVNQLADINSRNVKQKLKEVEDILGEAEVLQQFEINKGRKVVPVAGCRCISGLLKREALFRVARNSSVIFEGQLCSMRHLKSEADVIKSDTECGLQLENEEVTFEKGDRIICFQRRMVEQTTDWDPGF
ncbi:hypothetical protein HUJ05_012543 [Dendroctonus ponderosae]|nr:hypothetical protein HUJ05_012543 [Dendroctonus ponderosae]